MNRFYPLSVLLLAVLFSHAQYHQNFDTLITTGTGTYTKLPDGWGIYEIGTGSAADGKYAVGNGSSNTGNTYSFGTTNATDRALGTLASGSNFPSLGAIFFNETEGPLTSLTITYTGEQWRYGGRTTGTHDSLKFEYSLDAQGIVNNQGTWVHVRELDFLSPNIQGTVAATLDGNLAANRQTLTYTITGLNLQPGESIVLRWSDNDIASTDDGLAVDDFSISQGLAPGVMTSGATNTGGGTGGGGGTVTGTATSVPIFQSKLATDSGFLHLYGNLHGHSSLSDGRASTKEPADDYIYARGALGMDFLGISEHNHSDAGMHLPDYHKGHAQADLQNGLPNLAGDPFIALHGMEWGTIAGGGHVVVYGFEDSLINWEPGNYDIYVAKGDYMTLFDKVRHQPGAVATLAHPKSSDFTGLTGGYKGVADSAVVGVAIESGPALDYATTYNDYPASLAYMSYYRSLLKLGYRLGAGMDQDNHEMDFGTINANRLVVMAKDRSREALLRSLAGMRFYASNDYNARLSFSINGFVMGSSILTPSNLSGTVTHTDADGEGVTAIQLWGGKVGGADAALIQSSAAATLNFTTAQADGETWYYYTVVTQADGNKLVSSPIWVTMASAAPLPVRLVSFTGSLVNKTQARLTWTTSLEENSDYFEVERSADLRNFSPIGRATAKGAASTYSLQDVAPLSGINYYRLRQVDKDGKATYSNVVSLNVSAPVNLTVSPNPAKGRIVLTTGGIAGEKVQVRIVDMAGNQVYNKLHASGSITLDVSGFAGGVYVVRVGDSTAQLVIQK